MFTIENKIDIIPIPFKFVNTFLVYYKSNYVIIDTGYPKDCKKLYSKISLLTLDPDLTNLKAIIITHHHSDHSGALSYLKKINPNIRVIAHKKTFEYLKKGDNDFEQGYYTISRTLQILTRLSHKLIKNSGKFEPYFKNENDIEIENKPIFVDLFNFNFLEEEFIDDKDKNLYLKIFPTVGHTDDSISISIDKYLFAGDLVASSFNIFGNRYLPIIFNDLEILYNSWKNILSEKIEIILPSHGDSIEKNELAKYLFYFKKAYKI